jgi:hypothetical protein
MKLRAYILPILLCLGCSAGYDPVAGLIGSYRNHITIKGHIANERYYSPRTNFVCAVPPLLQPGAVIRDVLDSDSGIVEFRDDMGTLDRVDYVRAPDAFAQVQEKIEERKKLEGMVFQLLVDKTYTPLCQGTTVTSRKFISFPDGIKEDHALFGVAFLPKGSSIAEIHRGRYDAVRASLVLVRRGYVYVVTIQTIPNLFGGMGNGNNLSDEERNQRLLTQLEQWCGTFSFS